MDTTPFYREFVIPTMEEWLELGREEAGGELRSWTSPEGIDVQPLYVRRDLKTAEHVQVPAGQPPFVRGAMPTAGGVAWKITQEIRSIDPGEANLRCTEALEGGATALRVNVDPSEVSGVRIQSRADVETLLKDLPLYKYPMTLVIRDLRVATFACLMSPFEEPSRVPFVHCELDPISRLTETGSLRNSWETVLENTASIVAYSRAMVPHMKTLGVSGEVFHNGGSNIVFEIACALASGLDYLRGLNRWISIDDVTDRLRFTFAVGSNFFFEVAKLRAARMLWAKVVHQCGGRNQLMDIQAVGSRFVMTKYDPHVNILRGTLQAMAGIVGGAGSVLLRPFDECTNRVTNTAERLTRNMQLILQHESHLGIVQDPTAGSRYVETLTREIAGKAWGLFQHIEANGGLVECLRKGWIQDQIKAQAIARKNGVAFLGEVFIGTNKYPSFDASPPRGTSAETTLSYAQVPRDQARIEAWLNKVRESRSIDPKTLEYCISAARAGALFEELSHVIYDDRSAPEIIQPIPQWRATEEIEALRTRVEHMTRPPTAFLVSFGKASWRSAHVDFAMNFLGVAGIHSTRSGGEGSAESALNEAMESKAEIIVACSDDASYAEEVPAMVSRLKEKKPHSVFLVAGYPVDALDSLRESYVDAFIHLKSNIVETLTSVLDLTDKRGGRS